MAKRQLTIIMKVTVDIINLLVISKYFKQTRKVQEDIFAWLENHLSLKRNMVWIKWHISLKYNLLLEVNINIS